MTAPSPDDLPGLIEAIAAGIRSHRVECYTEGGDRFGWQCLTCRGDSGAIYLSIEVAEQYALGHSARAAYAAMVEHLGLVEQFGTDEHCDDHEWADEFVDEASARRAADADPYLTVVRRLVSRWTEVDHGDV